MLRLHDASLGYSVALQAKWLYQPPPYDPNAPAIQSGLSVFHNIRGSVIEELEQPIVFGGSSTGKPASVNTIAMLRPPSNYHIL